MTSSHESQHSRQLHTQQNQVYTTLFLRVNSTFCTSPGVDSCTANHSLNPFDMRFAYIFSLRHIMLYY